MESVLERPWNAEFKTEGKKLAEKLKNDFNEHLLKAEKILSDRDILLDKKEKDGWDKLKKLDAREKTLDARDLELTKRENELETAKRICEEDRKELAFEKEKWKIEEEAMYTKYGFKDNVIKLKVGERMFETYQTTLTRDPDSMLAIRFSGRHDPVTVDGAHFFDRDPKYFEYILNYLRDGSITAEILPRNTDELHKILKEADYYQLRGLKEEIEKIIQQSISNIEEAAKMTMGRDTMTREVRKIAQDTMRTLSAEMGLDEQKANKVVKESRRSKHDILTVQRGTRNKTGTN